MWIEAPIPKGQIFFFEDPTIFLGREKKKGGGWRGGWGAGGRGGESHNSQGDWPTEEL